MTQANKKFTSSTENSSEPLRIRGTREMQLPLGPRMNQAEVSQLLADMGKVARHYFKSLVGEVPATFTSNGVVKNVSEVFEDLCAGRAMVPPRGSCSLYGQPQVVFRPERLVIDDNSCRTFAVTDIKVGRNSQLAGCDGLIPGSSCTAYAFGVRLKCDTAQIGMYVGVDLVNQTDDWQPFPSATFIGLTAQ